MPRNDPLQQAQAPGEEPVQTTDGDALTVRGEGFRRTPLNQTALAFLKQSLALVSLPEPQVIADARAQQLGLTLDGGQTIAIDIALHKESKRKAPAYVIQITYADATAGLSREPLGVPEASGARPAGP